MTYEYFVGVKTLFDFANIKFIRLFLILLAFNNETVFTLTRPILLIARTSNKIVKSFYA